MSRLIVCISHTMNTAFAESRDGSDCRDGQYCILQHSNKIRCCWLLMYNRQTYLQGCGTCSLSDGGGLRKAFGEGLLYEWRHKSLGLLEKHFSNALIMQWIWAREPA